MGAGFDGANADQSLGVDDDVGQRVKGADGVRVADLGALDAAGFGLSVDALGAGALAVDVFVGGGIAVEQNAASLLMYVTQSGPLTNYAWSQAWSRGQRNSWMR